MADNREIGYKSFINIQFDDIEKYINNLKKSKLSYSDKDEAKFINDLYYFISGDEIKTADKLFNNAIELYYEDEEASRKYFQKLEVVIKQYAKKLDDLIYSVKHNNHLILINDKLNLIHKIKEDVFNHVLPMNNVKRQLGL